MLHTIDEKLYIKTKSKLNRMKVETVKKQTGLSNSSLQRIKKSKNYTDFKRILVKDRGPQYGVGDIWKSQSKAQDHSTSLLDDTLEAKQATPKKRSGLLGRFLGRR